jgi:hypothetical protein
LNALALSAMSKFSQANDLASELQAKLETADVATLSAMGHMFRRLDRDVDSADCYERAFLLAENEEMGLECFFSCLKGLQFRRCHQVRQFRLYS